MGGGWKGTFDGEAEEEEAEEEGEEEKEEGFSSFFLSRSRSLSLSLSLSLDSSKRSLLLFFDIDPGHNYIRSPKRGEKEKRTTTRQKNSIMRQHFQFCTHDYPVYYISSTLQIRTPYASSENEKQEILVHLPRTPRKRKGKNVYLYATVHAVHARTNE